MKTDYSLLEILESLNAGTASRRNLNLLIEHCCGISFVQIKYRYRSFRKILLASDSTVKELAVDAVAGLFSMDESGGFPALRDAFTKWQPPITNEDSARFFLTRLVGKSVEKYISEMLRGSDPFFAKVLDSLNYSIRKHGYSKIRILGVVYVVQQGKSKEPGKLPDAEFLDSLPDQLFFGGDKVMGELFDLVSADSGYRIALPLNALAMRIKHAHCRSAKFPAPQTAEGDTEVDAVLQKALRITFEKLDESYYRKNKITAQEKTGFESALIRIAEDLKNGGIEPGVHKYVLSQFDGLSIDDFNQRYRNIFEYLFKVLKKEIAEQLQ
ncbi:MAG: hypothetical protein AMXMBFR48_21260 [Ignavibacteriales bacterium]